MKLLQVPTANLEERIKEELEENPALEVGEEGVGSSRVDLQACKLEYSIVSPK